MTNFLDLALGGLLSGALVALLALGISLTYRTSGVLNLSQGALAAMGAYVALNASHIMPMAAAVLVAAVATAGVGAAIGILVETRLSRDSAVIAMVATLAIGIFLGQVLEQVWGSSVFFPNEIGLIPVTIGSVDLNRVYLWGFIVAGLTAVVLTLFLRFTRMGLAMRAISDTVEGARLSGIPAPAIRTLAWGLASALAAIAGFFVASQAGILSPDILDLYLVSALLAAVIGGLGSLSGAVAGAVLISVAESLFGFYAPSLTVNGNFLPLGIFTNTFLFLVLIAVLLVAPRGLAGGRSGRGV